PASCTIGLARALRRNAADDVRDRFLPPLLDTDYFAAERASQFLTEVQGGSDVGANVCEAEPVGDGSYLLTGEKWFCSVADAQQFLVTARPDAASEGTSGLGCFVLPRYLDGKPNGFSIRRLKDKLGTRGMASGEIDLDGARAWPIGPIEQGFRTVVGVVLNTSRWLTAVGSAGSMRRAYVEAAAYAQHRQAFGQPIAEFPVVRMTLASMKLTWLGALHACWALTDLEDRIDADTASTDDVAFHRFLVNALKYTASSAASEVARSGIEVLGGNGTIEDFSVMPRLYRDAMVYESWEGTHNVLCAQVFNDMKRLGLAEVVDSRVRAMLGEVDSPSGAVVLGALDDAMDSVRACLDDPTHGAAHFRAALGELMACVQAALLVRDGSPAADLFARTRLNTQYRPAADPDYLTSVDSVLAGDLDATG
ncbi:MAG: acyl-CoA dehydrogenase family protein, partial [Acidimicrobiales bacterium]